ncbi:kinase A anchor protein, partial [Fomes fomentarius]
GHIPEFRETLTSFTNDLLTTTPKIPGLDRSIVVNARRMHFTLGTMSLEAKEEPEHTLEAATKLLNDIKADVNALLHGEKLCVSLDSMDIMRPEKGNPERAHVMWVGPTPGAINDRFMVVAKFIQNAFRDAGLLVDEDRKLKVRPTYNLHLLHCTVINSIYRKPRAKNRIPFSYTAILASDAVKSLNGKGKGQATAKKAVKQGPTAVDLGEWECDEIQICEMGSWGPEGEYVAAARIPLD